MGFPMARNLLAAGLPLAVHNRTRAKAEPLAAGWAAVAASAAEAAERARIVITMLADDQAIETLARRSRREGRAGPPRGARDAQRRALRFAGLPDERRRMSRGAFSPPGFQLALGLKDIRLVLRTADQLGAPMPVAGVAYDHFLSAASRGCGGLDWTAVSEVVHEAAGLAPAWGSSTSDPVNVR
ncbi:MAG: hypothetical protein AUF63_00850 [Candidatus Rokubacteria bacterium 13_1_20CM_70_15]|nr:MAG: hypothetical protein AUF63_00850 [Candidatus Rokubacteria bacterium 13_1_20CM_70_15]